MENKRTINIADAKKETERQKEVFNAKQNLYGILLASHTPSVRMNNDSDSEYMCCGFSNRGIVYSFNVDDDGTLRYDLSKRLSFTMPSRPINSVYWNDEDGEISLFFQYELADEKPIAH